MPHMPSIDNQSAPALQWEPAPPQLWLAENDVHLWRARLDSPFLLPRLRETLTIHEALVAERMPDRVDRRQFIASRGFLRIVLGCYLEMLPSQVPLVDGDDRKLRLAAPHNDLYFDASCSDGLSLLAVARHGELGLNIERIRMNLPFEEMARCYFEPEETWSVLTARGRERARNFFEHWTTMEAAGRAQCGRREKIAIHKLSPDDGFAASLALRGEASRLRYWDWSIAA